MAKFAVDGFVVHTLLDPLPDGGDGKFIMISEITSFGTEWEDNWNWCLDGCCVTSSVVASTAGASVRPPPLHASPPSQHPDPRWPLPAQRQDPKQVLHRRPPLLRHPLRFLRPNWVREHQEFKHKRLIRWASTS